MSKAIEASHRVRLSQISPGLVDSVSQLSHVFHKFAARYSITCFIEGNGFDGDEPVCESFLIGSVILRDTDVDRLLVSWGDSIASLEKLSFGQIQTSTASCF